MIVRYDQISESKFNAVKRLATVGATATSGKNVTISVAARSINLNIIVVSICKYNRFILNLMTRRFWKLKLTYRLPSVERLSADNVICRRRLFL